MIKFVEDDIVKNTMILFNTSSPMYTYRIHIVHVASFKNYILK